jgi:hypothetical protein
MCQWTHVESLTFSSPLPHTPLSHREFCLLRFFLRFSRTVLKYECVLTQSFASSLPALSPLLTIKAGPGADVDGLRGCAALFLPMPHPSD